MEDQFIRGPDGTRTLASGSAGRTSRSDSDLELAGSAASGGVGVIGDSIGMAGIHSMAAAVTTPGAERSTTETISTVQDVDLTATADTAPTVDMKPTADTEPTVGTEPTAVEFTTIREQSLDRSTEIARLREDMRSPTSDRAEFARAPSAATIVADRSGVFPRAAAPASVVEDSTEAGAAVAFMAVVADADGGYFIL